jgi:methionine-S-sulfoxide reductase
VAPKPKEEVATLAGGCFWGMEDLLRKQPGVIAIEVGYTGGTVPNATYEHHEGHAEAVNIRFDPSKTSFEALLRFFFRMHDPTTLNRQGNDMGKRQVEAAPRHRGHQGGSLVARRGVPPGLPRQAPRRVYLPLCAGLIPRP